VIVTVKTADVMSRNVAQILTFRRALMPPCSGHIHKFTCLDNEASWILWHRGIYTAVYKSHIPKITVLIQKILKRVIACWFCVHVIPHIPWQNVILDL